MQRRRMLQLEGKGSHVSQISICQPTPVVNYSDQRNRRGRGRDEQWERRPEDIYIYNVSQLLPWIPRVCTQVSISHSFFDKCFRPGKKRDTRWNREERYAVGKNLWRGGTCVTRISISQSILPISRTEGGRYEQKSEMRVCMPLRYLHPSQIFSFFFWLLVPIGQTEGWKARKRKPEKGYTLCLDSHVNP